MVDTVRYWDGAGWTDHYGPAALAGSAAAVAPARTPSVDDDDQRACPYCGNAMANLGTRCGHCGGQLRPCPKCNDLVATYTRDKWVGMARGGTRSQHRCVTCDSVLEGPKW